MSISFILSLASSLLAFVLFLIPYLYKVSDKRRKWYKKFSSWGFLMVACVLGNALIQIAKDNISSREQSNRDSTIAHLKTSLDEIDSAVSKKFDSLGYKFEINTNRIIAKSDSTAISVSGKFAPQGGVPSMGLSQDNIGQQVIVTFSGDTAYFKIITENNGSGNAKNVIATLMIIPANGNLIKLKSYPMEFKTDFVASKRFYTLLPKTWNFPRTDSIFIYLKMDFSSEDGSRRYHNKKLYLWANKALVGELDPTARESAFLKECCKIRL